MAATGLRHCVDGYLAVGSAVINILTQHGTVLARLEHLREVVAAWRSLLPEQIPLALVAGTAEAAAMQFLGRGGRPASYQPGAVVAVRRAYVVASLRRGEAATSDGGSVGIVKASGRRAAITWAEAEGGALCTGHNPVAVTTTCLQLAIAAIQHRKTVVIVDLIGSAGCAAGGRGLSDAVASACVSVGAPLRNPRGGGEIAMGRAFVNREVVLFSLDSRQARTSATLADPVVADLAATMARRAQHSAPSDGLVWINGCEQFETDRLAELLSLGASIRTAFLLGTVSGSVAARLAEEVNVVVISGVAPPGFAPAYTRRVSAQRGPGTPPAELLLRQDADELSILVRSPLRMLTDCRAIR